MEYLCYRCYYASTIKELKPSSKIKHLTVESSKKMKCCKNCNGRVFLTNLPRTK